MDYPDLCRESPRGAGAARARSTRTVLVGTLSISQQQLVEIAKALTLDCRILILDEPTAALTERETRVLFGIMRELAARGISIIYISHRMVEIFDNCDRVSIFRDGRRVAHRRGRRDHPGRHRQQHGRPGHRQALSRRSRARPSACPDALMEVRGLTDRRRFRDVGFALRRGEILGIAGLIGAGRSEIVKGICGLQRGHQRRGHPRRQAVLRSAATATASTTASSTSSEDRKGDGVFLDLSIAANVSAIDLDQVSSRGGIDRRAQEADAGRTRLGDRLGLKRGGIDEPVSSLSGGNQQKVAIAKMLSVEPRVIFLDEPTRGVDVGAKAEIHRILRDLARERRRASSSSPPNCRS